MATTQVDVDLANSLTGSEAAKKALAGDGDTPVYQLDWRARVGLYAVYAAIGTVNGFFATFLATPIICQYLFGPIGEHVTIEQCNVAPSIFQMSWNFKLFLAFVLDNVSFFGSRRKGWLLFGWTGGLIMLVVNALLVDGFIENKDFTSYLYCLMGMCIFYTFSDVAGDGLIIEISKFEPEDQRGYILTTCQMVRFACMTGVTAFGTLFMSGDYYQPDDSSDDAVKLPFEIAPFSYIHWCLLAFAIPSYICMWMWLKDPPVVEHHERGLKGMSDSFGKIWTALKSYAMFMLLIQNTGIQGIAAMLNPATQPIAMIARPSSLQNAGGAFGGNFLFVLGVFLFRRYLLNYNWRITLIWTYALMSAASLACVMIVYNTGGFSQNGWFYMIQTSVPLLIQGLNQVLSCIAVIEIAPAGLEATIYELLISSMNGAIALQAVLQSQLAAPFKLNEVTAHNWADNHCAQNNGTDWYDPSDKCAGYQSSMSGASFATLGINIGGVLIFCWFMPKNGQHCREWRDKISWHKPWAAWLNFFIFVVPFTYAMVGVFSFN